jgi:excisionase family DNA binding protein
MEVDEVAAFCRVSRATIYSKLKTRELESVKIGRRRLVTRDALDRWLAKQAA